MHVYPEWLDILSWIYLGVSFVCAAFILGDEFRRPQKMMIMNLVWPITALYLGPLAVWGYLTSGLKMSKQRMQQMRSEVRQEIEREERTGQAGQQRAAANQAPPSSEQVAVGVCHCGAGCTLGDICAEWWVFAMGLSFTGGDFQTRLLLDFFLAWGFGVVFQYFTIVPMRGLSFRRGLMEAIRADTLSIVAFEIGLFAWMALTYFVLFPGPHLAPTDAVFWFMMQVGMIIGFFTSYPANRLLLGKGWKEEMPQYKNQMKQKMLREAAQTSG